MPTKPANLIYNFHENLPLVTSLILELEFIAIRFIFIIVREIDASILLHSTRSFTSHFTDRVKRTDNIMTIHNKSVF